MKSIIHSRRLRERMTLQLKKKSWLAEHHHNIFHFILRRVSRILKPKHILQMRCYSKNFFFTHDHSISDISFWSIATLLFFSFGIMIQLFYILIDFVPPVNSWNLSILKISWHWYCILYHNDDMPIAHFIVFLSVVVSGSNNVSRTKNHSYPFFYLSQQNIPYQLSS